MATVQIDAKSFSETLEKGGIVLIDWWAPWCGPCRAFAPVYERVAARHPDIVFGKVNTEDQPQLAAQFDISAIPTLMVIKNKTLLYSQAGMLPERGLEELIKQAREIDVESLKAGAKAKSSSANAA